MLHIYHLKGSTPLRRSSYSSCKWLVTVLSEPSPPVLLGSRQAREYFRIFLLVRDQQAGVGRPQDLHL